MKRGPTVKRYPDAAIPLMRGLERINATIHRACTEMKLLSDPTLVALVHAIETRDRRTDALNSYLAKFQSGELNEKIHRR